MYKGGKKAGENCGIRHTGQQDFDALGAWNIKKRGKNITQKDMELFLSKPEVIWETLSGRQKNCSVILWTGT